MNMEMPKHVSRQWYRRCHQKVDFEGDTRTPRTETPGQDPTHEGSHANQLPHQTTIGVATSATKINTFRTIGQINPDAPKAISNVNIRQGKTFNDIILESDDRMALMTAAGVMVSNGNVDFVSGTDTSATLRRK